MHTPLTTTIAIHRKRTTKGRTVSFTSYVLLITTIFNKDQKTLRKLLLPVETILLSVLFIPCKEGQIIGSFM